MKRTILLLVATFLLPQGTAHGALPSDRLTNPSCQRYFYLYTLTVEAEPRRDLYVRGQTVKIDFVVTRPGPEDPGGNGVPTPEQVPRTPAEGVEVHAAFWAGDHYAYGKAVTDENGEAMVEVDTVLDMAPGQIDLEVSGHKYYNRGGCPDGEEVGYNYYPKAFRLL